ncbi:MAG: hypothetical protein ACPGMQ_10095 [Pirellulales bacterium]
MKKVTLMNESVTETGGVFEDLDAVRELQDAASNPNIYFIDDDSVKETAASHQAGDVSPETRRS